MTDKHLKYFFKQPQKKNQLLKTQQVGLTGPELHGFPYKDKSNQLFLHFYMIIIFLVQIAEGLSEVNNSKAGPT